MKLCGVLYTLPVPVAARIKAWVWGRSLAGIAGSNPAGEMDVCFIVCCEVDVSASGWSLVQRSPTECGVRVWYGSLKSEETLAPTGGCCATEKSWITLTTFVAACQ